MLPPECMPPMMPKPSRFVKMGSYMVCLECSMAAQYCRCASRAPADTEPEDGPAAQSLAQRILDVKR